MEVRVIDHFDIADLEFDVPKRHRVNVFFDMHRTIRDMIISDACIARKSDGSACKFPRKRSLYVCENHADILNDIHQPCRRAVVATYSSDGRIGARTLKLISHLFDDKSATIIEHQHKNPCVKGRTYRVKHVVLDVLRTRVVDDVDYTKELIISAVDLAVDRP